MQTFIGPFIQYGCRRTAGLVLLLTTLVGTARADEIHWRFDYGAARKEAQDRDLPLLLDFGTETCHWCKRLDATTFRHDAIVGMVNQRFIPLKVDAEKQSTLAEALHIRSYPTLVLAGALMGGEITAAVRELRSEGILVISLNMAGSVPEAADLVVSDPVQAGVMAVMAVADTARFDIARQEGRRY